MSNSKNILDILIEGILLAVDKKINNAKFDKTVTLSVIEVLADNKYLVRLNGKDYTLKSVTSTVYNVADSVRVIIPQNNLKDMFII